MPKSAFPTLHFTKAHRSLASVASRLVSGPNMSVHSFDDDDDDYGCYVIELHRCHIGRSFVGS